MLTIAYLLLLFITNLPTLAISESLASNLGLRTRRLVVSTISNYSLATTSSSLTIIASTRSRETYIGPPSTPLGVLVPVVVTDLE